jgi:multidrug efflux pump subunit AcrA (membrane-fusion protein)
MKKGGKRGSSAPIGRFISLLTIATAIGIAVYVAHRNTVMPWTDAATIDADVVHVAAAIGGRIVEIPVTENTLVSEGDLLFQIDPVPYRLAVARAEADLAIAEASLDTEERLLSTQRSAAKVAAEQVQRAEANLELAKRTVERLAPLATKGYVPTQQLDQAQTSQHDAETTLQQARIQEAAAVAAIDTDAAARATVRARKAALAIAQRGLEDTTVRATHAGRVVGLSVSTGEMIAPSQTIRVQDAGSDSLHDPPKRLLPILVHEVVADIDDAASEIVLIVHWVGGAHSELRLPKRRRGQRNSTSADIIQAVRQLVLIASDNLIAGLLNRNGLKTGNGNRWTRERVTSMRSNYHIPVFKPADDRIEPWQRRKAPEDRAQDAPAGCIPHRTANRA